jgi:hypothetical protein
MFKSIGTGSKIPLFEINRKNICCAYNLSPEFIIQIEVLEKVYCFSSL